MPDVALWPQLREALAGALSAEAQPWLAEIRGASNGTGGRLVLAVTTRMAEALIGEQYGERILTAARQLGHEASSLEFRVLDLESPPAGAQAPRTDAPTESPAAPTWEPWSRVPLSVLCDPDISPNAKIVWAVLGTYGGCHQIYPGLSDIAARSALCPRSIQKAVRELQDRGYLAVEENRGRGRTNCYTLLPGPGKHANRAGFPKKHARMGRKTR